MNPYVLITAARNEAAFIERTIQAVVSQRILPRRWIIVSNGSTDRTEDIIQKYALQYPFIELLKMPGDQERNFGAKAKAIRSGCKRLRNIDYHFIGNLDADVSFDPAYYQTVLSKFAGNSNLGVCGGTRYDLYKGKLIRIRCAKNSVGGPFQFFRRECYEAIGGYMPIKFGGIDAVAEVTARMLGWEVRSFSDIKVIHHRYTGAATANALQSRFKDGIKNYVIGYHPVFLTLRAVRAVFDRPFLLGSLLWLAGYSWAGVRKYDRPVSERFIRFLRSEQMGRLRLSLLGKMGL